MIAIAFNSVLSFSVVCLPSKWSYSYRRMLNLFTIFICSPVFSITRDIFHLSISIISIRTIVNKRDDFFIRVSDIFPDMNEKYSSVLEGRN